MQRRLGGRKGAEEKPYHDELVMIMYAAQTGADGRARWSA